MVEWGVKIVDFGLKLKMLRKQAGLTQQQLATQLGITKSVVSFYELRHAVHHLRCLQSWHGFFTSAQITYWGLIRVKLSMYPDWMKRIYPHCVRW